MTLSTAKQQQFCRLKLYEVKHNISLNDVHTVADLGGCGRTPLGVLQRNSWSTNFENSEDSRQHDYYYYQFYLAAISHEIFLRVGGREGMKGLGALQRHQLPHPPCKNPGSATVYIHGNNETDKTINVSKIAPASSFLSPKCRNCSRDPDHAH